MTKHQTLEKEYRRLASEFIHTLSNKTSLITVTETLINKDLTKATILFTVLPEERETAALDFLNRRKQDLKEYLKKHMKRRIVSYIDLKIDAGDKYRQRIDALLR